MLLNTTDGVCVVVDDLRPADSPKPRKTPVVLLHGLSQQRNYWSAVSSRLIDQHVVVMDQRGHGEAAADDVGPERDYSMERLALDVVEVLDALEIRQAVLVGHSWGASVALHASVAHADRVAACALIDGGLVGPRHLVGPAGSREQVREALRPPGLGIEESEFWAAMSSGPFAAFWTEEVRRCLEPTFRVDDEGRIHTRIGMERHMAVLDALFDYDPAPDIAAMSRPAWAVVCEPAPGSRANGPVETAWTTARDRVLQDLPASFLPQRWYGAVHDVPLQWPALVAGLIATVVERADG